MGRVANSEAQMEQGGTVLGKGFGVITDLQMGPDGYLYVLGYDGTIYRIVTSFNLSSP
jgi:glucose/arabinose dehydrogenase